MAMMIRLLQLAIVGLLALSITATPHSRFRRQNGFTNSTPQRRTPADPTLIRGGFTGFGQFQPGQDFRGTGRGGLTIPANGGSQVFNPINPPPPIGGKPGNGLTSGGEGGLVGGVFNSGFQQRPQQNGPATSQYLRCLERCPLVSQYNPVCGSDGKNYYNESRLECSKRCGSSVQVVKAGTC